jgi:hypothetical protein
MPLRCFPDLVGLAHLPVVIGALFAPAGQNSGLHVMEGLDDENKTSRINSACLCDALLKACRPPGRICYILHDEAFGEGYSTVVQIGGWG